MADTRWLSAWALASVAFGAASLLVPLYFVAIGGETLMLGVLAGVAAAAGAPGALVFGRVADRTGRRRSLVLLALGLATAALVLVSLTEWTWLVVAGNGLLWFASGAVTPALTLLVTVGTAERDWPARFALLNRYQGWGWAGGLVLGLLWTALLSGPLGPLVAQQTLLWVCALATAAAAVLAGGWLPADPPTLDRPRGYDSGVVFALYLVSSVGSALFYDRAGALAERYSPSGLQVGGLLARAGLHPAVAVVGLWLPATLAGTVVNGVLFLLIGVAWAVIAVTAASLVTRLAPAAIRGEALGLYTAISGLANGVGAVLGGWLGGIGFLLAFAVAGALVLVGAVLVGVVWRRSAAASLADGSLSMQ